jgi:hypothetical protein
MTVNITGLNFQPGCLAQLGTVPLTVTLCQSATVSAQVPPGTDAGYYSVSVTNPDAQMGTLVNAYTATNPIPLITSVTPALWTASSTNLPVTITGNLYRNTGTPGVLRAALNGTALVNVAYVDQTTLSAEIPFSSPGLDLGGYTLTVVNPGPTDPSGSLAYAFTVYTYTTQATCDAGVSDCNDAKGEPDGSWASLSDGEVITFDFGTSSGIMNGTGYDLVFYEHPNDPGIWLDYVTIEIGDVVSWHTLFEWDGDNPGDITGTNIDSYANDPLGPDPGEVDNEHIPSADLYPGGLSYNTGIAIDIGVAAQPPLTHSGPYRWVRVSAPSGGGDPAEIDAILRLH